MESRQTPAPLAISGLTMCPSAVITVYVGRRGLGAVLQGPGRRHRTPGDPRALHASSFPWELQAPLCPAAEQSYRPNVRPETNVLMLRVCPSQGPTEARGARGPSSTQTRARSL